MSGCFPEFSRVNVPGGYKPIQEYQVGDEVLSPQGKKLVPAVVREIFKSEGELLSLVTTHGALLTTKDQLFRCHDGKDRKTENLMGQFVGYLLEEFNGDK